MNLNGRILFEGKSPINGKPIVIIATGFTEKSANPKTGFMLQTWINSSQLKPNEAFKTNEGGFGESVCGDCPHALYNEPKKNGYAPCYVRTYHAPRSVYECYSKGNYPHIKNDWHLFDNLPVRLGSFGDPCCIPVEILTNILSRCSSHTGYTHQIKHPNFDKRYLSICQVSADTPKQAIAYQKLGAKTFRVALDGEEICLSETVGTQCQDCLLCDGSKQNIAIAVHGSRKSKFKSNLIPIKSVA